MFPNILFLLQKYVDPLTMCILAGQWMQLRRCGDIQIWGAETSYAFISRLDVVRTYRTAILGRERNVATFSTFFLPKYVSGFIYIHRHTHSPSHHRKSRRSNYYQPHTVCTVSPTPAREFLSQQFDTSFFLKFRAYCWNELVRRRRFKPPAIPEFRI